MVSSHFHPGAQLVGLGKGMDKEAKPFQELETPVLDRPAHGPDPTLGRAWSDAKGVASTGRPGSEDTHHI